MIVIDDIRKNLIEAIKQSCLTQKTLAEKLGVSQQTISAYINGVKMPTIETLANLCVILDLDGNNLLCVR